MNSEIDINSFLSNTSDLNSFLNITSEINYEDELNKIKTGNLEELLQFKDNLNIVNEIICELKEKSEKIKVEINYLEDIQSILIQTFSEISRKNI